MTPISLNVENFYYYIIGYYIYTDNQYKLKLLYYKLNYYDKTNDKITDLIVDNVDASKILGLFGGVYYFQNKGLSCEYMKVTNQPNNYLVCFYITIRDDKLYLISNFYDISTSSLEITDDYSPPDAEEISDVISIQSLTSNDRQTAFISLLFRNNQLFSIKFYFEYHFWTSNDVEFYGKSLVNSDCKNELYGMKLYYLADAQKIILSCINPISTVYAFFYGDDLNQINSYNQFSQCESIYGHSIVYSKNDLSFYIVSDVICQNDKRYYEPLVGDLSEIEIEIDSTQIIEDTEAKKEEENEEETTNYYEEEKIEEKEEENQEEMNEEELEIETTEIKFDCSGLEKCKECDEESFDINLCISCNKEQNYYYLNQPYSVKNNRYIDCVNEQTKPTNYYLNKKNEDYEPCYTTCATCKNGGNFEENNCTSCDGIYFLKNPEDNYSSNCVLKCKYFYYLKNNNMYTCTDTSSCPEDYNYIIKDKLKCQMIAKLIKNINIDIIVNVL